MDRFEAFASAISFMWCQDRLLNREKWGMIRAWLHGAALFADNHDDTESLYLLRDIAAQYQMESAK